MKTENLFTSQKSNVQFNDITSGAMVSSGTVSINPLNGIGGSHHYFTAHTDDVALRLASLENKIKELEDTITKLSDLSNARRIINE